MREYSAYIDVSNKGLKLAFQTFMANVEQMVVYFQDASQIIATSIFRVTGFGLAWMLHPEDGGVKFLRNFGTNSLSYLV
jgi:hypothetical protein